MFMRARRRQRLALAALKMREAVEKYPPEVLDADGAWRVGGSAKRCWREALDDIDRAASPEEES